MTGFSMRLGVPPLLLAALALACHPATPPAAGASTDSLVAPDTITGTQLERAERSRGTLSVRAMRDIAVITPDLGGRLTVSAVETIFPGQTERLQGVRLWMDGGYSEGGRGVYLDYDELAPLIHGLDAIAAIDPAGLPLRDYEAKYQTRGGLAVTNFNDEHGKQQVQISLGWAVPTTAYLPLARLGEVRSALMTAKGVLDSLTASRPKVSR